MAASAPSHSMSEDDAKAAWLAKLDKPAWGNAASAMHSVAVEAAVVQQMEEDCVSGDDLARDTLSREDEAKREWLSKLDTVAWGQTASYVVVLGAGGEGGVARTSRRAHLGNGGQGARRRRHRGRIQRRARG